MCVDPWVKHRDWLSVSVLRIGHALTSSRTHSAGGRIDSPRGGSVMTDDTWLYGLDPMTTESPVMSLSIDDSVVWERTDVEKKERRGWVGPASARGEDEDLVLAHGARCLVKVVLMGLCVCVALSEVEPRKEQPTCERAGLIISLSHATHCVGIRPAERAEVGRLAPLPAPLARQDDCRGDFVRSTVLAANYTPPAERARHTPNWIVTEPWLGVLPPRPPCLPVALPFFPPWRVQKCPCRSQDPLAYLLELRHCQVYGRGNVGLFWIQSQWWC